MKFLLFLLLVAILLSTSKAGLCSLRLSLRRKTEWDGKKCNSNLGAVVRLRGGCVSERDDYSSLCNLDYRFFLAGGVCAAISHGITTPLDVVKTRMQSFPERYNGGVVRATQDIVESDGVTFLLAGLMPTLVGYGFEGALKFGCYELFKGVLKNLTEYSFINYLFASLMAGALASVVLCPMEDARIKMVSDEKYNRLGLVGALLRVHRKSGIWSTFKNVDAMLMKQVPYTMAKQVSFDIFAKSIYALLESFRVETQGIHFLIMMASAFCASILACLASQPGDVLLTHSTHASFSENVHHIMTTDGWRGFFAGLVARILHVSSIITSQLVVYDLVKQAVGLPMTGH